MSNGRPRYTADFIRSVGHDLRGVEIIDFGAPTVTNDDGLEVTKPGRGPNGARPTIKVTKRFDTSSPMLFKLQQSGERLPKVVITSWTDRGTVDRGLVRPAGHLTAMTLKDVAVTDISRLPDGTDAIELRYTDIE